MAKVVGVHGILQQFRGADTLRSVWEPGIRDGLRAAGYESPEKVDTEVVFYGDIFRPPGAKSSDVPVIDPNSLDQDEIELLRALAASTKSSQLEGAKGVPASVQTLLRVLIQTKFFEGLVGRNGERALLFGLRQVRLYLHDHEIRKDVQARFDAAIKADTQVVVGHSLGSVVAYEGLCKGKHPQVRAYVSLGSPLGIRPIVFDRLAPECTNGKGCFPAVNSWHNVADEGDLVALIKELRPLFGSGSEIVDKRVNNGSDSHNIGRYLTSREVGLGVASGL